MYINFKSKYKKFLWLLIGFLLACFYIQKVNAQIPDYSYDLVEQQRISMIWNELEGKTMQQANFTSSNSYLTDNTHVLKQEEYPYLSVRVYDPDKTAFPALYYREYTFIDDIDNLTWLTQIYSYQQRYRVNVSGNYHLITITIDTRDNSIVSKTSAFYLNRQYLTHDFNSGAGGNNRSYTNFNLYKNGNIYLSSSFTYSILPTYLNGYTKVTLPVGTQYTMISSSQITSGYVFIPIEDFNNYGGRLSYFDKDLSSQPYTSYIQDYTITPDGLYARQYFDLSSYNGADWVMFSKYIYLEGEDNITYDIWIPTDSYSSSVVVTPNSSGGNDFDFSYVDQNGELQADTISSVDLTPPQPLLGDIFQNFTSNDFGLSSIITAPLPLIQSLNSASCSDISLPLGIFGGAHDNRLILPCMTPLYQNWFGGFFTLYQTITTGFIAYYVGLGFFNKIKQLKDPENDKIEVVDL